MKTTLRALLVGGALVSLLPGTARAQQAFLKTEDLRLLYFDATHSYLAPHSARCFENSMRFHRQLFEWTPSERVSVMLLDFADMGNAAAGAVPRNMISVDIAPLSFAFETFW